MNQDFLLMRIGEKMLEENMSLLNTPTRNSKEAACHTSVTSDFSDARSFLNTSRDFEEKAVECDLNLPRSSSISEDYERNSIGTNETSRNKTNQKVTPGLKNVKINSQLCRTYLNNPHHSSVAANNCGTSLWFVSNTSRRSSEMNNREKTLVFCVQSPSYMKAQGIQDSEVTQETPVSQKLQKLVDHDGVVLNTSKSKNLSEREVPEGDRPLIQSRLNQSHRGNKYPNSKSPNNPVMSKSPITIESQHGNLFVESDSSRESEESPSSYKKKLEDSSRRYYNLVLRKTAVLQNSVTQTSVSHVRTSLMIRRRRKKWWRDFMNKIEMKEKRRMQTKDSTSKGSEKLLESPERYTSPQNLRSSGDNVSSAEVKNNSLFIKLPQKYLSKHHMIGDEEESSEGSFDLDSPESDILPIAESTHIDNIFACNQQSNKQLTTTHKEAVKYQTKSNNLDGMRNERVGDEQLSSVTRSFLNFPCKQYSIKKVRLKRNCIKKSKVRPSISKALNVESIRYSLQTSNHKSVSGGDVSDFTDSDDSESSVVYKRCPELKTLLDEIMLRRAAAAVAAEACLKPVQQTSLHHSFAHVNLKPEKGAKKNQLGKNTSKPKRVPKPPDPNKVCDGSVYKNSRLARPASWINQRFYNKITKAFSKNLGEYDIVSNAEVEKYVLKLHLLVKAVLKIPYNKKRTQNEDSKILAVMEHLYKKGLIKTKFDFLKFCKDYLPEVFLAKGMIYPFPDGPHVPSQEKESAMYLLKDLNL